MTIGRGRRCRAAFASARRGAGLGLIGVLVLAVPVVAGTGESRVDDPRDVGTRLDLKTLTHVDDGSSIVYTAETYAPFSDEAAVFKWGIDRDRDEAFDLIIFTEWRGGKLTGGVKDTAGRQLAPAAVSRPGPTAIRVSFPAGVLGGVPVYRYAVDAESDGDGDGPGDPGERDLAPNSGLIQHRLGAVVPPAAGEARTASAAPSPAAEPAKSQAQAQERAANLPRTGPGDRGLLPWAGTVLMVGGVLVVLGAKRNRTRRGAVTGGIR